MTVVDEILSLITKRRKQVLLHAVVYYNFHDNLIDNDVYDKWLRELSTLQRDHPHIAGLATYERAAFTPVKGTINGFILPLKNMYVNEIACDLLEFRWVLKYDPQLAAQEIDLRDQFYFYCLTT